MGIVAALFGAFGPRFWWKGLAIVAVAALIGALCNTVLRLHNDQRLGVADVITPGSIAQGYAVALTSALVWYGVGALLGFVIRKLIVSLSTRLADTDPHL